MRTDARSSIGAGIDAARDYPAMVPAVRGDQFDVTLRKLFIEQIAVIDKMPNNSSGPPSVAFLSSVALDKSDFMWASRRRPCARRVKDHEHLK